MYSSLTQYNIYFYLTVTVNVTNTDENTILLERKTIDLHTYFQKCYPYNCLMIIFTDKSDMQNPKTNFFVSHVTAKRSPRSEKFFQ